MGLLVTNGLTKGAKARTSASPSSSSPKAAGLAASASPVVPWTTEGLGFAKADAVLSSSNSIAAAALLK